MNDYLSESLAGLHAAAKNDIHLRYKLLATKKADDPVESFCNIATEAGFPITVGDIMTLDNALWSNMLDSINGGATYPFFEWSDTYENFICSL